jgi:hypothetical protein
LRYLSAIILKHFNILITFLFKALWLASFRLFCLSSLVKGFLALFFLYWTEKFRQKYR